MKYEPYTPKFFVGDTVWVMQMNKPVELKIVFTEITYGTDMPGNLSVGVEHTLVGGHTLIECTPNCPGDFIYRTKKELLDNLYETRKMWIEALDEMVRVKEQAYTNAKQSLEDALCNRINNHFQ